MQIRLLSWNLHGTPFAPERAQRLARAGRRILAERADLALLQEIWLEADAQRLAQLLRPAFVPASEPPASLFGRKTGLLAFLRRDADWRLTDSGFELYREEAPWWRVFEGDALADKGIQVLRLQGGSERVVVLHTHLQASYAGRLYTKVREAQLAQLRSVAEAEGEGALVLAAGDLNAEPNDPLYAQIRSFWADLTEAFRLACGCGTSIAEDGRIGWLDYVLARARDAKRVRERGVRRIERAGRDGSYSDHDGLVATLEIADRVAAVPSLLWLGLARLARPSTRREWLAALAGVAACAGVESLRVAAPWFASRATRDPLPPSGTSAMLTARARPRPRA
jgi:endonuclease/exonuclease/phosphatase family metal-dependent hydrolase